MGIIRLFDSTKLQHMANGYFNDDVSKQAWKGGTSIGFKLILWVIYTACLQFYLGMSTTVSGIIGFLLAFAPGQVWAAIAWLGGIAKDIIGFVIKALVSIIKGVAKGFQNKNKNRKRR